MGNSCGCCISSGEKKTAVMSPPHPHPEAVVVDSLDSIKLLIANADPIQQIDPLINFIQNQLTRLKLNPTEESTSSSSGGIQVEAVASSTTLAAQIIDKISTEAQTFADSEVAKAIGSTAVSAAKMIGEAHWIFIALSMAACALQRCGTVTSNVEECKELMVTIGEAAKDLKKFREAMTGLDQSEKVGKAVKVVAEGAFMCCEYIAKGKASRNLSYITKWIEQHCDGSSSKAIRLFLSTFSKFPSFRLR